MHGVSFSLIELYLYCNANSVIYPLESTRIPSVLPSTCITLVCFDRQRRLLAINGDRNRPYYNVAGCRNVEGVKKTAFTLGCRNKHLSRHLFWNIFVLVDHCKNEALHGCCNLPGPVSRPAGLVWHHIWAPRWHIDSCLYLTYWTLIVPMFPSF